MVKQSIKFPQPFYFLIERNPGKLGRGQKRGAGTACPGTVQFAMHLLEVDR